MPARPVSALPLPKTQNQKEEVKATTTDPIKKTTNEVQHLEAKKQENATPKAEDQEAVEIKETSEKKSPNQPEKEELAKEEEPKSPEPQASPENPISEEKPTASTQEPKEDLPSTKNDPANPKKTSKPSKKRKKPKTTQLKKIRDIIKIFQQMTVLEPCKDLEKHSNLPVIDLSLDPQIEHVTPTRAREYRKDYKRDHYSRKRDSYRSRKTFDGKKKKRTRTGKPGERISLAKGKYPNII